MTLRISVSDSEVEDEVTLEEAQMSLPEIEDQEVFEEQQVTGISRPASLAWLCFEKLKMYKKNGKQYSVFGKNATPPFIRHKTLLILYSITFKS